MTRIWQNTPAGSSHTIKIYAARDETYSFQIGIQGMLTNVYVSNTPLKGPNGAEISGADIALFREQYVFVNSAPSWQQGGPNPPGGAGLYPDGLIPFIDPETGLAPIGGVILAVPFTLSAGVNQVIWVDIHAPVTSPAGDYHGTFIISGDQGTATIQATLHVWNFALPKVPTYKTAIQVDPRHQDLKMARELLRNRQSPDWVVPEDELALMARGLNATNLWFASGLGVECDGALMSPAPAVQQFKDAYALHQPGLLIYDFSADQISRCPQAFPTMKQWAANMHSANPNIHNMVTVTPFPALEDDGTGTGRSAVDIWVELPLEWDQHTAELRKLQAKGDTVWLYNAMISDGYSPKFEANYTALDWRLGVGYICAVLDIKGFQQWSVDQWGSGDPWHLLDQSPVSGDGMEVYPGAEVGISGYAPSVRLKWHRDGVNDYEYVQILKGLGQGVWALEQAASVGPDWKYWSRDYRQVETVRIALGSKIDELLRADNSENHK